MAVFALGMMQRDGIVVLLGWLMTGLSIGLLAFAWKAVRATVEHLVEQVTAVGLPIP